MILISLALCADGAIGNFQEKFLKQYNAGNSEIVSSYHSHLIRALCRNSIFFVCLVILHAFYAPVIYNGCAYTLLKIFKGLPDNFP